jgi:hypothetical protein
MDYAGLQTAITGWADRTDVAGEVPSFIEFAEQMFNHGFPTAQIAPLRVREMQTTSSITMFDGVGSLPDDYLQYISVKSMASTPRPMQNVTRTFTDYAYADGAAGLSNYFSIIGDQVNVFPSSGQDVNILYYAKIPALSVSNTSNWLLEKQSSLYLHAGLMHLGLYTRDNDLVLRSQAIVATAIDGLNQTDVLSSYASTGTRLRMFTP